MNQSILTREIYVMTYYISVGCTIDVQISQF